MDDATSDRVQVTLPGTMLAQIDAQVGGGFVDREEFIRSAVRHYVEYLQSVNNAAGPGQLMG